MEDEKCYTSYAVKGHDSHTDLWIVIHGLVYDCTRFIDDHPGGVEVLMDVAGKDATDVFEDVGHSDEARLFLEGLRIGKLKTEENIDSIAKTSSSSVKSSISYSLGKRHYINFYTIFGLVVLAGIVSTSFVVHSRELFYSRP
ncbi:cytochrome b5-like heme/steroid binding domain-containing protein [Lipomyces orientalis]|uniref:Cytochrome b5-like heme/steroid binding domain-containing protein n=1 Tax=Lipomyces orientalis TaxID=1233043 RepID=A0ACC3TCT0_9ASCO